MTLIRMLWSGKGLIGTAGPAAYFLLPEIFSNPVRESVCGMTVATLLKARDIRSIGKVIVKGTRVSKLRLQPSSAE